MIDPSCAIHILHLASGITVSWFSSPSLVPLLFIDHLVLMCSRVLFLHDSIESQGFTGHMLLIPALHKSQTFLLSVRALVSFCQVSRNLRDGIGRLTSPLASPVSSLPPGFSVVVTCALLKLIFCSEVWDVNKTAILILQIFY